MFDREHKIATIGGGTGSPVVNEALLRTGRVSFISAITTPFDNGGSTKGDRLDSYGTQIAYSDGIRVLFSLVEPNKSDSPEVQVLKRWFTQRDIRDRVPGRGIVNNSFSEDGGISQIEDDFKTLHVPLHGEVLFSSTKPSQIVFTTETLNVLRGEDFLDQNAISEDMVKHIRLDPSVPVYSRAAKAIEKADLIILSCGSFYGSLLCNFLPEGMREAMRASKAQVYLVTNLVSTRNETHEATLLSLARTVGDYSGIDITGVVIPNISRQEFEEKNPEAARLYRTRESSHFLGWDDKTIYEAECEGIKVIRHDALKVVSVPEREKIIIRHDPVRLAETFKKLDF